MNLLSLKGPLFMLVWESDLITKCVLLILLIMSIVCWTIFLIKILYIYKEKNALKKALYQLTKVKTVDGLQRLAHRYDDRVVGMLITYLCEHAELEIPQSEKIDRSVDAVLMSFDSYLGILSTTAAVAPLLGLFGTVWGLVHSFIRISALKSADIATVAPGIAEALITTLAGLIVAIPALILFNIINSHVKIVENVLLELANHTAKICDQKNEGVLYGTHVSIASQSHETTP